MFVLGWKNPKSLGYSKLEGRSIDDEMIPNGESKHEAGWLGKRVEIVVTVLRYSDGVIVNATYSPKSIHI